MANFLHVTSVYLILFFSYFSNCQLNEGDFCITSRRENGICQNIRMCEPFIRILRQKPLSDSDQKYLRDSLCRYEKTIPIVCCPRVTPPPPVTTFAPQTLVTTTQLIPIIEPVGNHPNLRLLPDTQCGKSFVTKIWGGTETALGDYPWMALIAYRRKNGNETFLCGGALINNRYILTAAHCVVGTNPYTVSSIRLGEHNRQTDPDCDIIEDDEDCAPNVINIGVEQVIPHPNYNRITKHHDIALIRLSSPVTINSYVYPICIPIDLSVMERNYMNENLTVAGWGRVSATESFSNIKMHVNIPFVGNTQCKEIYSNFNRDIIDAQMCAGGIAGKDSCTGDSGGPLMSSDLKESDRTIHYHAIGIVSFGPLNCGSRGIPGVYTRVASYVKWILDQLRE